MTRHTAIVVGEPIDGTTEADSGKLAAKVQAIVNGQTVVSMTSANVGRLMAVCIVYDST